MFNRIEIVPQCTSLPTYNYSSRHASQVPYEAGT
jgi:hypothetical protein